MIRKALRSHVGEITDIYNYSILNNPISNADLSSQDANYWEEKIDDDNYFILVNEDENKQLTGYGIVKPSTIGPNYQNVFELSIHIHSEHREDGIAAKIYFAMIAQFPIKENVYFIVYVYDGSSQNVKLIEKIKLIVGYKIKFLYEGITDGITTFFNTNKPEKQKQLPNNIDCVW